MTPQELQTKLVQIEEHAYASLDAHAHGGLVKERQRMIIALARFIRMNVECGSDGLEAGAARDLLDARPMPREERQARRLVQQGEELAFAYGTETHA